MKRRCWEVCVIRISVVAITLCRWHVVWGAPFTVPPPNGRVQWEAEDAVAERGWHRIDHSWASEGAYVSSEGGAKGGLLHFPFDLDSAACFQVRPVWWRHGEQLSARCFPYPLKSEAGPSVLGVCADRVFFLCPRAGRIGVIHPIDAEVTGSIDVGGYPVDMLCNDKTGIVCVADAAGDRLVLIDAAAATVAATVNVPGTPWSLTEAGGKVVAACRDGASLTVVDPIRRVVERQIDTGTSPASVCTLSKSGSRVGVVLGPRTFDIASCDEVPPSRDDYVFGSRDSCDAFGAWYRVARFYTRSPDVLLVDVRENMQDKDIPKPWRSRPRGTWEIDISKVTALPDTAAEFPEGIFRATGVSAIDAYPRLVQRRTPAGDRVACPGEKVLIFAAPAAGTVGWIDLDQPDSVRRLVVGGCPVDLVIDQDTGLGYVCDVGKDRIIVLDATKGAVLREISLPGEPWSIDVTEGRLYVLLRRSQTLVMLDASSGNVMARREFGSPPLMVRVQERGVIRSPNISVPECVAVKLGERVYDISTGEPVTGTGHVPSREKRDQVEIVVARRGDTASRWGTDADALLTVGPWESPETAKQIGTWRGAAAVEASEPFGHVVSADGLSALVDLGTEPVLNGEVPFSIEAWVRWQGPGTSNVKRGEDPMSCVIGDRGLNAGCMLMIQHDGHALFNINGLRQGQDLDLAIVASSRPVSRGGWSHIVGTYDPQKMVIGVSVNGVRAEKDIAAPMHKSASRWAIGAQRADGPYYWFKGDIAGVRIYPRALTEKDARERYERSTPYHTVSFKAEGSYCIRVDGRKWLDVSDIADASRWPQRPLGPKDTPGTISLAVDDGPAFDWCRNAWLIPGTGEFMVNGDERFGSRNAPVFSLPPGKHVLNVRAYGPYACLDALEVVRVPENHPNLGLEPVPENNQWVYAKGEPVTVRVVLSGPQVSAGQVELSLHDYRGQLLTQRPVGVTQGKWPQTHEVTFNNLSATGRVRLTARFSDAEGETHISRQLLLLPPIDHPRLLFRKDQEDDIRRRIEEYHNVFACFLDYLQRHCGKEDFLPKAFTMKESVGERTYLLAWRALACQFAADFLEEGTPGPCAEAVLSLYDRKPAYYDMFHFHEALFPGAAASLLDMAAEDPIVRKDVAETFSGRRGNFNVLPQALVGIEMPLQERDRAMLNRVGIWLTNVETYFGAHGGVRGGNWWMSTWTGCHCPLNGPGFSLFYLRNLLGEDRLLEDQAFRGFYTHTRYLSPCLLKSWGNRCCGGPAGNPADRSIPGPQGTPGKWILSSLGRHPLMLSESGWLTRLARMNAGADLSETGSTDALFDQAVSVAIPIALACGWFDPNAPIVRRDELPPTAFFEGEGNVVMRDAAGEEEALILLTSGVRDVVYRDQPNHFQIYRGKDPLIGTGSLWADDVNSVPAWGNVVVAGTAWQQRWRINVGAEHFRPDERRVINRYVPEFHEYAVRDEHLWGIRAAHGGHSFLSKWSPLGFHQHQDDVFLKEGDIAAYQTSPQYDYVAGDATNAWPVSQVREAYRQLLFIRPDVVIVYDRFRTMDPSLKTRWHAAVLPNPSIEGKHFTVTGKNSALQGRFLLPLNAHIQALRPGTSPLYRGLFTGPPQHVLVVEPGAEEVGDEYLVVMRIGEAKLEPAQAEVKLADDTVHIFVSWGTSKVEVSFQRHGPVGGTIDLQTGAGHVVRALPEKVDDSYRYWRDDPRYSAWTTEERFRFMAISE